jgi:hypothetical protein
MRVYAETPGFRLRQALIDLGTGGWIILWIWIGVSIHELIQKLAGPGRTIEQAGTNFAGSLRSAGSKVAEIPLVGEALRAPFEGAAEGGDALQRAGAAQQDAVSTLAIWLGVLVALLPIVWVLFRYLPWRVGWIREAGAAVRLRGEGGENLYLFALRAIASRPFHELEKATPDPGRAFAAGDYVGLARLELSELGLVAYPPAARPATDSRA